jgi:hypothetical protein
MLLTRIRRRIRIQMNMRTWSESESEQSLLGSTTLQFGKDQNQKFISGSLQISDPGQCFSELSDEVVDEFMYFWFRSKAETGSCQG